MTSLTQMLPIILLFLLVVESIVVAANSIQQGGDVMRRQRRNLQQQSHQEEVATSSILKTTPEKAQGRGQSMDARKGISDMGATSGVDTRAAPSAHVSDVSLASAEKKDAQQANAAANGGAKKSANSSLSTNAIRKNRTNSTTAQTSSAVSSKDKKTTNKATTTALVVGTQKLLAPAQESSKNATISSKPSCSCMTIYNPGRRCCQRVIRRTHKMGVVMTRLLFRSDPRIDSSWQFRKVIQHDIDYRDIVFTRNWYDSLISGYLYHKSGRECWLNQNGINLTETRHHYRSERIVFRQDWENFLLWHKRRGMELQPAKQDRDLCQYLAQESDEAGMKVYMDIAWGRYYKYLYNQWKVVIMPTGVKPYKYYKGDWDRNRTQFVCYEDLIEQPQATVRRVYDWFNLPLPRSGQRRRLVYEGPHSTSRDPVLRAGLKQVIQKLDVLYFNRTYGMLNDYFQCGDEFKTIKKR